MEDATLLSPTGSRVVRGLWLLVLVLGPGIAVSAGAAAPAPEPSTTEVREALRRLGPPGYLWGRLAVEEESPEGAWTPLGGVEVRLYLVVPTILAELEHIRQSARASGESYATAVTRFQGILATHEARLERILRDPGSPGTAAGTPRTTHRQVTDPNGLFAFDDLPSGQWLLVAIRVTAYSRPDARADPAPRRSPTREQRFLPRAGTPVREAEVWLTTVQMAPGQRASLLLTDRARWLVGPIR